MFVWPKSVCNNKPVVLGESKHTAEIHNQGSLETLIEKHAKKLLIAIPSFTGIINSMAVDGFMRLIGSVANLKEKFEVFTSMPQRTNIVTARNIIIEQAIEQDCDYILWLDDDMVIKPDVNLVERLLSYDKDIIAPLFFSRAYPFIPMIFKRKMHGGKFCIYDNIIDYPKGLLKVDGIGFGCVLTKVECFKKLDKPYFWANDIFGEDLFFCENATRNGIEIYCDSTIDVGHIGEPVVSWECLHNSAKQANYEYIKNKNIEDQKKADTFYANLHKNIGKKIDIVMPCYHNVEITKNAIESIIKLTEDVNYNIVPIIDGYDKELINYFKEKKIKTILHKESLGFIKSTNAGIKKAREDTDFVLLLNNDILIEDPKWLINLVNSFQADTGSVAPVSNFVMGFQNLAYNTLPIEHCAKFLIGFCMLIRKDVLDKVGLLDEVFGIGGNDDLDISIRIREAGYKLKINRGVYVHHLGFQSLGKVFKDYEEIEGITRPKLIEKWGKEKVDDLFTMTDNFILNGV